MDSLNLAIALLLPWLGGYFWLAWVERLFSHEAMSTSRQIGYGLFLGYGVLYGIVLACNRIFGSVTFMPVLLILVLFALAGAALFALGRKNDSPVRLPVSPAASASNRFASLLFWLFMSWAALHLVLVAIEILYRPVFPWDAWLNWMYRAKAWFYSGQVFMLDAPADWLRDGGHAAYNVSANHYPTFVPVLALWMATALGQWSETLVNLPVLCCGIALGLALYGHCRECGLERWSSAFAAYLLLSIPLVGTHLALGGGADIWMAGFTGLGFAALLHGTIRDHRFEIFLGLGMVGLGIATKLEGAVWFLAALLTVALARHTRGTVLALIALVSLAAFGWAVGITHLDIPLLGGFGVVNGRLHIPLLGSYALQSADLWDDYRDNFFSNGTWHLLWTFILVSAVSLKFLPAGTLRRTLVAFYSVLLATQVFMFTATESGQWAEDWTAINRLPLHFALPLVFSLVILTQALLQRGKLTLPSKRLFALPIVGLTITFGGAITYLLFAYPGSSGAAAKTFTAKDMRFVTGGGRQVGAVSIIEQYQNNIAILSSGPVLLDTRQMGLARVETAGASQNSATFFWRTGNGPDALHSSKVSGRGTRWINLYDSPHWQGIATEIGLIFYADGDRTVEFRAIELAPSRLILHLGKLSQDWRETTTWSQSSVNWLNAGAAKPTVSLPALMAAWVLVTLLLAMVVARRAPDIYSCTLLCAVAAWATLDVRWTINSLYQARETLTAYPLAGADHLEFGDDGFTRQLVETARPELEQSGKRTIIMAEGDRMQFQVFRAKYHALPAATYVHEGPVETIPTQIADHVLVLKERYTAPGHKPATAAEYSKVINLRGHLRAKAIWETEEGFLLSISPGSDPAKPEP